MAREFCCEHCKEAVENESKSKLTPYGQKVVNDLRRSVLPYLRRTNAIDPVQLQYLQAGLTVMESIGWWEFRNGGYDE
jgi:hypothetical protein